MAKMMGAILPGNSTVELKEFEIPTPGHGQVLVQTKATTICGSDIRCIYNEHLGKGPEGYTPGLIAGHEPCGIIVEEGEGLKRFKKGDRVIIYHISGCGLCNDCRRGYYISCTSHHRMAYGWQRNGGMAPYILADEKDLIGLPDELTFKDGAQVACGFGTVYEAIEKIGICGNDAVLVTGLGPVGLAALMLAKAMGANQLIGVEMNEYRIALAKKLGLVDQVFKPSDDVLAEILKATGGRGVERAIDASANDSGRQLAIRATRQWGKIAFVGEGGTCHFNPSEDIIHGQKTIFGSWVTSLWKMEELVERLVRWGIHPEDLITDEFPLEKADEAYALMAGGQCGKVAVTFEQINPALVPKKTLYTGKEMPGIGLGTFGSDKYTPEQVSEAVYGAITSGYRMIDCASVYQNEDRIGQVISRIMREGVAKREELFVISKVWNDSHGQGQVLSSCNKSLADLQLNYLDLFLIHWPFPNAHAPGCDVDSRNPNARPFYVEQFMATWRQCEELVKKGLVRHIGMSNMTIAKLEAVLPLCEIKPAALEMECHPAFQQQQLFEYAIAHQMVPIGYCPIGSPSRPERDKTAEDIVDTELPAVVSAAKAHNIHPALICLKWAVQRGQIPIPFSVKESQYIGNLECIIHDPLTAEEMEAIAREDRECRLVKGQVFLWESAKSWEDLWDMDGKIST